MKNLMNILLVLIFVVSAILPTKFSHVVEASTADYHNLLTNQVSSIGIMNKEDSDLVGVVYAKVADFDQNGSDELYIVTRSTPHDSYEERLYEDDKLIYENTIPGPGGGRGSDASLRIGKGKQGIYFSHSSSYGSGGFGAGMLTDSESWGAFSILKNGQVKEILSHSAREFGYDMEILSEYIKSGETEYLTEEGQALYENWDGASTGYNGFEYYINDKEVNKATYETKLKPYDSVDWEEIIDGGFGSNHPVVDSEVVIHQVLNQLEEALKPKNMGEDLKDSMDQEL